jgi:hypothetical protein
VHRIPRTAELRADGDGEAGTVFERARVGDGLFNTEAHFLVRVGIVGEHLLGECDQGRGQNLAGAEIELDLVDLHVLPDESAGLVRVEVRSGVVREGRVLRETRVQGQVFRGCNQTVVVVSVLAASRARS